MTMIQTDLGMELVGGNQKINKKIPKRAQDNFYERIILNFTYFRLSITASMIPCFPYFTASSADM